MPTIGTLVRRPLTSPSASWSNSQLPVRFLFFSLPRKGRRRRPGVWRPGHTATFVAVATGEPSAERAPRHGTPLRSDGDERAPPPPSVGTHSRKSRSESDRAERNQLLTRSVPVPAGPAFRKTRWTFGHRQAGGRSKGPRLPAASACAVVHTVGSGPDEQTVDHPSAAHRSSTFFLLSLITNDHVVHV